MLSGVSFKPFKFHVEQPDTSSRQPKTMQTMQKKYALNTGRYVLTKNKIVADTSR